MQKMFHGKFMAIVKVQHVAETYTITVNVNMMDVKVTTRSKVIKKQVFKDKERRKINSIVNWEKEEQLKKSMVETIEQI
jgi:hypothetical protein